MIKLQYSAVRQIYKIVSYFSMYVCITSINNKILILAYIFWCQLASFFQGNF
ncbi:hypothetical protein HanXRQr2_Chr16g0768291 [Helianthus annuus]|uniref:Uncharacterized protein n=1 Tax=Helianthus annuus TaxID=4232 RepID=A0A9K3DVP6_HELAN|nr:hypothetical protein HanXRQr2_Chr16g0768291 [Helianthus annuus]